ncbi:hypothetical protein GCM10023216_31450 [Isoptericola chiayiensis]|uniref:YncI copper-binding domain-containing protein n=1 Tax=Isoptericola chiayiensis TaxID=579446 RepID=A0ABP8YQQ4_9MICO|nr:YcnI family protein [Isoptericola chiayiensis]NOW01721.1 uncharacterized protein YcnI [Isoptericola chiayiensis]
MHRSTSDHRAALPRRAALSALAAAGLVAALPTSALAHVTVTPSTSGAGETAVLRVQIPHGCDGSATTAITIRIPDGVTDVDAAGTQRWTVEQTGESLTYATDEPLPDAVTAEVEFTVRLPDEEGATLVFPVVQECEQGEVAWTEVAEPGQDHDSLDKPAPVVVVTAADGDPADAEHDHNEHAESEHAETVSPQTETPAAAGGADATAATDDPSNPLMVYGATGAAVVGALAIVAVMIRRRGHR